MSISAALTRSEKGRLKSCEAVIERGKTVFIEVGQALTEIRDAKLYRDTHATFDAYCRERWEIGRSRAYELIDQAKVVEAISEAGGDLSGAPDISGRDARALKDDLPAATAAIRERVQAGQDPKQDTADVVAETRAAKDTLRQQRTAETLKPETSARDPLSPFPPQQAVSAPPEPPDEASRQKDAAATWMRLSAELGLLSGPNIWAGLHPRERARFRQQNAALGDILEFFSEQE